MIYIKQPYASEIQKKLKRYKNKEFTEEELKLFEKEKNIAKRFKANWVDISLPNFII